MKTLVGSSANRFAYVGRTDDGVTLNPGVEVVLLMAEPRYRFAGTEDFKKIDKEASIEDVRFFVDRAGLADLIGSLAGALGDLMDTAAILDEDGIDVPDVDPAALFGKIAAAFGGAAADEPRSSAAAEPEATDARQ